MIRNFPYLLLLLAPVLLAVGCEDDDPVIENPEELITDLTYTLTPTGGGTTVTLSFSDPDGDGGSNPTVNVSGDLAPATTYRGVVTLADNSVVGAPRDVTSEVSAEAADHQFFFVTGGGLGATLTYADADADGQPVGLVTELTTGATASTGNLTIILRHEPAKDAAGVAIGNPTPAGGETDIEVAFPLTVAN